jgi:hypothetical protein
VNGRPPLLWFRHVRYGCRNLETRRITFFDYSVKLKAYLPGIADGYAGLISVKREFARNVDGLIDVGGSKFYIRHGITENCYAYGCIRVAVINVQEQNILTVTVGVGFDTQELSLQNNCFSDVVFRLGGGDGVCLGVGLGKAYTQDS